MGILRNGALHRTLHLRIEGILRSGVAPITVLLVGKRLAQEAREDAAQGALQGEHAVSWSCPAVAHLLEKGAIILGERDLVDALDLVQTLLGEAWLELIPIRL
jgi:hypothetical protein